MNFDTFVKVCHSVGVMRKTKTLKNKYKTIEYYKFRLWHPITWVIFISIIFLRHVPRILKGILDENKEEYEIIKRRNKK